MEELNKALISLKLGKTRDPQSWVCELFKDGIIGTDLRMSLPMMFNKVKDENHLPECFRTAQVTMIHKKKCKQELNNWRGIFVSSILGTILHERIDQQVATSMTDSQIGAQKRPNL